MKSIVRLWSGIVLAAAALQTGGILRADDQPSDAQTPLPEPPPVEAPEVPEVAETVDPLVTMAREAIEISKRRYLDGDVHTPWQIMHGVLAYRDRYEIKVKGRKVNALEWVCDGPYFKGEPWWEKTPHGGRGHRYTVPYAFEGHPNQFLAIMSMTNLPPEHKFRAAGGEVTMAQMVEHAKLDVRTDNPTEEITWTLWFLSLYVPPDAQWENRKGEPWSMERLVRTEIDMQVEGGPCGGTHGLFALARARNAYLKTGRPLRGVWLEAEQKLQKYIATARAYQNAEDGTFSANYFKGPMLSRDFKTRLSTSGHTLEVLMVALADDQIKEEWVRRAVHAIAKDLIDHKSDPAECGALYHSLDSLVLYLERVQPKTAIAAREAGTETPVPFRTNGPDPLISPMGVRR